MELIEVNDVKKKAKIYLETKSFVWIQEQTTSGFLNNYNGFILSIHDDFLVLQDRILPQPIPIQLDRVTEFDISKLKEEGGENEETNMS